VDEKPATDLDLVEEPGERAARLRGRDPPHSALI
jgi:hypothetical protein